jgi:anthranilate 1,2-dioxygenase small subunit
MKDVQLRLDIADFILASATALDRCDYDTWLDLFAAETRYVVMPRENLELDLPIGVMHCSSKDSLADRISVLIHASKFNPHYDRHIVGGTAIRERSEYEVRTATNFMVVQTTLTGVSKLFCSGEYEDRILLGEQMKIADRRVILDTFSVPNCLATPL